MTVFKYFFKVLASYKWLIILYTAILVFFGAFSLSTSEEQINFTETKPNIAIIDYDNTLLSRHLKEYMSEKTNVKIIEESKIDDAIFYRDISYAIYIDNHFTEEFLAGNNPKIEVKTTKDYGSSIAEMLLDKYRKVIGLYQSLGYQEEEILAHSSQILKSDVEVEITSALDTDALSKATYFYNFANYSILAGSIFVVAMILYSFNERKLKMRNYISKMGIYRINKYLYFGNFMFCFLLWFLYVIISFILVGDIMFSLNGLCYILNSFLFMLCALSIGFLIGNIIHNKEAISGIVNVVALGTSFLCGCFVPIEFLPDFVKKISHILPTYWYVKSNEWISEIEVFDFVHVYPLFINMAVILLFALFFFVLTNMIIGKRKCVN